MTSQLKRRLIRQIFFSAIFSLSLIMPKAAQAEPTKEFVMSCSYGVLAGTLVGAATLAFTDKPGDNLNKVARGASLGLYAGILLGLYVVYGVPSAPEEDQPVTGIQPTNKKLVSKLQIFPLLSERGLDGGAVSYNILKF